MVDFLKSTSNRSLMRLMSVVVLVVAIFATVYQVTTGDIDLSQQVMLYAFAFFPKVIQKLIEAKYGNKEINER